MSLLRDGVVQLQAEISLIVWDAADCLDIKQLKLWFKTYRIPAISPDYDEWY